MRKHILYIVGIVCILIIGVAFVYRPLLNYLHSSSHQTPYNIILVVSDQQAFQLRPADNYHLIGHEELQRRGVTFTNHYTAAAMCSPSRAAFLTGTPPQVNGVTDQMGYYFISSLDPKRPNMGSVLKSLGYHTAYFGKFEMDKTVLLSKDNNNTSTAIQAYGFDEFNPDGDTSGSTRQGYYGDPYYMGEAIRWLHKNVESNSSTQKPFFMVVSLLNPHDIMYADANIPGREAAQQAQIPIIAPAPNEALYAKQWHFNLPSTLNEALTANGMPEALFEYYSGWSTTLGFIPSDRKDMWTNYYNYYLNAIRDNDRKLQQLNDALTEMDMWKNTIVIFTADHGDMGGTHGGLRGKGPFAYEENAHIPLIIAHPKAQPGSVCHALTSHLDLLPTFIGFTGLSSSVSAQLVGHDFSGLLPHPDRAAVNAIRPGILFNYVGISTVNSGFLSNVLASSFTKQTPPALSTINLSKRGFLTFVFDGRYKFARYYAPNAFNTPTTLEQIMQNNDVQLFDLKTDPSEAHNLALEPQKYAAIILHMNELLNTLIAKEVGNNNGQFLSKLNGSAT